MANVNSPERRRREMNAYYEGCLAKEYGEPRKACPYKISLLGLGTHWLRGWDSTKRKYHSTANMTPAAPKRKETK